MNHTFFDLLSKITKPTALAKHNYLDRGKHFLKGREYIRTVEESFRSCLCY